MTAALSILFLLHTGPVLALACSQLAGHWLSSQDAMGPVTFSNVLFNSGQKAYSFNGNTSKVVLDSSQLWEPLLQEPGFAFDAWFYFNSTGLAPTAVNLDPSSPDFSWIFGFREETQKAGFSLYVNTNPTLVPPGASYALTLYLGTSALWTLDFSPAVVSNTWYHVALFSEWVQGTTPKFTYIRLVDETGNTVAEKNFTQGMYTLASTCCATTIGRKNETSLPYPFTGLMRDVRMWKWRKENGIPALWNQNTWVVPCPTTPTPTPTPRSPTSTSLAPTSATTGTGTGTGTGPAPSPTSIGPATSPTGTTGPAPSPTSTGPATSPTSTGPAPSSTGTTGGNTQTAPVGSWASGLRISW